MDQFQYQSLKPLSPDWMVYPHRPICNLVNSACVYVWAFQIQFSVAFLCDTILSTVFVTLIFAFIYAKHDQTVWQRAQPHYVHAKMLPVKST